MSQFNNKSVVITGACKGIGKGIAEHFASKGANLVIASNDKIIHETGQQINQKYSGVRVESKVVDVSSEQQVKDLYQFTFDTFSAIHISIHNAGIITIKPFDEMTHEEFNKVLHVNTTGVWLCSREAAKYMAKQGSGRIVNTSSLQGRNGFIYTPHYAASKMGVIGITQSLALELAPKNITVNSVCPGIIESDMWKYNDKVWGEMLSTPDKTYQEGELIAEWVSNIPLKRAGTPQDVANAIAFFASDETDYITGQALNVCGGMAMN
ncbi:SDR family oxidoreductase [Vibrio sp. SCSIO 43132]|uniref:SDR family oxidoreductase n=1 Tax=Vibrio sp. SCSIO 43132 TaxID=2779363 RepID=UPI001CA7E618|nr:SDR family oxidoreductase [Vibrio sp. SCSIO 43132]UAB71201.1 SDR family oxidoreductase [Vibrio sp. SCSIO 43132]